MSNPVVVIRQMVNQADEKIGQHCWVWCPGCQEMHAPIIPNEDGTKPPTGPCWTWNGRRDEHFGVEPSYLCWHGEKDGVKTGVCHSFIRDGHWQFLGDCSHHLAGQTVRMVPVPSWILRG